MTQKLPYGCRIEKAKNEDKWILNYLVWRFLKEEVLGFELRFMSFQLLKIIGLCLLIGLQIFILNSLDVSGQFFLKITIFYTVYLIIYILISLIWWIIFAWTDPLWSWHKYWVIKYKNIIIGHATLLDYPDHNTISYVYVHPQWRKKGLGQYLVKYLVTQTTKKVYLIAKPKLLSFYGKLGFIPLDWQHISPELKQYFNVFSPHPKLWGFPLYLMEYQRELSS